MIPKNSSKLISKVLSPALQFWLRSQLDQVESLHLELSGSDRQILRGYLPLVTLSSNRAVYQGIHLAQAEVVGHNISINLGGILKGEAFRLREPILVSTKVILDHHCLNLSLSSPLFSKALTDLLGQILTQNSQDNISNYTDTLKKIEINWQEFRLYSEKLTIIGNCINSTTPIKSVILRTGLSLANSHTLRLDNILVENLPEFPNFSLDEFLIDLGSEVNIEALTLTEEEIWLSGCLQVTS